MRAMEHFSPPDTRPAIGAWRECNAGGTSRRSGEWTIGELVRDIVARLDLATPCPAADPWQPER